jgi:hypothetical protein
LGIGIDTVVHSTHTQSEVSGAARRVRFAKLIWFRGRDDFAAKSKFVKRASEALILVNVIGDWFEDETLA